MSTLNKLLKEIRKSTGSSSFMDSKYGTITGYVNTGIYALNRIITGDVYKGIPNGKVILIGGESQTGKSSLCAQIASNALKDGFDHIFYFDSEGGALKSFFENFNCDVNKIEQILLESVEDATVKVLATLSQLSQIKETEEGKNLRFMVIIDSLGALVRTKLLSDAEKGKQASEMGGRAKLVNDLMKALTVPALKSDTPIIVVNHVYDDPSSMFPSKIKAQGGGKAKDYVSTVSIQCTKSLEKNETKEDGSLYSGSYLKFFTTKNRLAKPFFEAHMFIDFSKGVRKYDGLIDIAKKYGYIKEEGRSLIIPSYSETRKVKESELLVNDEIWNTILNDLNEKTKKEMQYSSAAEMTELNSKIESSEDVPVENVISEIIEEDSTKPKKRK